MCVYTVSLAGPTEALRQRQDGLAGLRPDAVQRRRNSPPMHSVLCTPEAYNLHAYSYSKQEANGCL